MAQKRFVARSRISSWFIQPVFTKPVVIKKYLKKGVCGLMLHLCILFVLSMLFAQPIWAGQQAQSTATNEIDPHLLLTSVGPTQVELTTHTVDMQLLYNGSFSLAVDASYRLHNKAATEVTIPLQLAPDSVDGQPLPFDAARVSNVSLIVDDETGDLQQTGDARYATQVRLDADERLVLRIQYQLLYPATLLPRIRYSTNALQTWAGVISFRLNIAAPELVATESWLRVEPSNWRYDITDNPRLPDIKWLYDEISFPVGPIVFQVIDPTLWTRLAEAELAATSGSPARNFLLLGDLYRQLYGEGSLFTSAATGREEDKEAKAISSIRERFYVQAVAAYTSGVESSNAGNGEPSDLVGLHIALARLYRERSADDINNSAIYARLMASEATEAMRFMAPDDARRQELSRWQFEGLYNIYTIERTKRNWPQAIALLEQLERVIESNPLETYTNSQVDANLIADERRTITIYQALNLLEQGDRDGALLLAGTQIVDTDLQPPLTAQSLFSSWQITMTIRSRMERSDSAIIDGIDLNMVGTATPNQYQAAYTSLQELLARWWNVDETRTRPTIQDITNKQTTRTNVPMVYQVTIPLASKDDARLLLQNMPEGDEWLLLRSLLSQVDPIVKNNVGLISQQLEISQRLDLRAVGDQWRSVADALEDQANRFEDSGAAFIGETGGAVDSAAAEASLRARIQEVTYRNAATQWQTLARDSWVLSEINVQSDDASEAMIWLTTVVSPPQTRQIINSHLYTTRLYIFLFSTLLGIFLLACLLWWLIGY